MDVVVTDKKGVAVAALTKEDVTVTEDGVPQVVTSFDGSGGPRGRPGRKAETSGLHQHASEKRTGRSFVVVFDDIHLTPFLSQRAKGAVAEFLKTGAPRATTSPWWPRAERPGGARAWRRAATSSWPP